MGNFNYFSKATFSAALAALALILLPELAYALPGGLSVDTPFGGIGGGGEAGGIAAALCEIAGWFTGGVGQAVASLAVIFLGIAAFFGKVTWGLAIMFAAGIFAIFGSSDIVYAITGGKGHGCCDGISVGGSILGARVEACFGG
ncbi:MAG: hypothetical protein COV36_03430 [Alphaproteobacteria bacterium CG11_big_fil_rev_8_21_14_0_20_44_7]|nr:MAG: hypothetical protein COV36_03430 [Alphaproteobacteria bacterium CG11_big_fil_rev_8_21_14_0_20_44_7]